MSKRKKRIMTLEEEIARERCADCVCLVDDKGKWVCNESGRLCSNTEDCPEGMESIAELIHNKKH